MKSFLSSDNVLANLEERYCYGKDASNFKSEYKVPDLVVFVETIEDVQKVLRYANEHEIPVVSRGAGTNMVGACVCTEGGIVINFSKMNKILDFDPISLTITAQPGVVLNEVKKTAESVGLFYPPDPSNYRVSTVGGSIAQSSSGAKAFKYGTTKDYVLSLKVVTADGTLITLGADTLKDSVGYHLAQLMVGSEGTLAVIVEATLKLLPKPKSGSLLIAYFNDIENSLKAVDKILLEGVYPAAIDFMDKKSVKTVSDFINCGLLLDYECLLLIELDGFESALTEQLSIIKSVMTAYGAGGVTEFKDADADLIWRARNSSFAAATRLAPDVVSDDIIVPRSKISDMIKYCHNTAEKYGIEMCLVGHIGDGNIHPQMILDLTNEEEYRKYLTVKELIYAETLRLGGTISAEHGIGIEKKKYLTNVIDNNSINFMKMIKRTFDPKNILNPGKIFNL